MVKKIMAALLAVCLLFSTLPSAMFAGTGDEGRDNDGIKLEITSLEAIPEINQGDAIGWVTIGFALDIVEVDQSFQANDTFRVDTNIGMLFDADWTCALSHLSLKNNEGEEIGYLSITVDGVTFTVAEAGAEQDHIAGKISTPSMLKAQDVGATADDPSVTRRLNVGDKSVDIVFDYVAPAPQPGTSNPQSVDIDNLWKNAWSGNLNELGASVDIMVNPMGSMDLYGSTTYDAETAKKAASAAGINDGYDHKLDEYDNFFVKDPIQNHGFIDESSVMICAAVPPIVEAKDGYYVRSGYFVPEGTYYAQEGGTARPYIDREGSYGINKMIKLTQTAGESLDDFEKRVKEKSLSWGIYRDDDGNETFMCNFGHIGSDNPEENNGITYQELADKGWINKDYLTDSAYAKIFGKNGASGGGVVTYYIHFNAYYPDVVGREPVNNQIIYSPNTADTDQGRNIAQFYINNGSGTGVARANELIIKLIDAETKKPITNQTFKIEKQTADGSWEETALSAVTDENGRISMQHFPEGTYRVVQTSFADGYEQVSNFTESGNDTVNNLDENGVFTVKSSDTFGYGTVVTNKKTDTTTVAYHFVNGTEGISGTELPDEAMAYLPTDTESYEVGETVEAKAPAETTVIGPKSNSDDTAGVWTFEGYDQNSVKVTKENVGAGIIFTGTWTWKQADAIKVEPADITIYMGGDAGFEGSVNDEGTIVSDGSLPEPGFRVTLPKELAEKDLTSLSFKDSSDSAKEWKFKSYDGKSSEIFKLEPTGNNTEKTRMQFKQADETIVTSDQFDVSKAVNQTLTMSLYKGEGDAAVGDVVVTDDDGLIYYVDSSTTADLTVRGTTSAAKYADVQPTDDAIDKGEPGVVAADDTVYTINEGTVQAEKAGIALLFDEIIDTNDDDRLGLLKDRADKELANSRGTRHYDIKYLDLVDRDNGNAWVKANKSVTVYWPLPEGTNKNTDFTLLHFEDLHREMNINDVADEIEKCTVSDVSIKEVTNTHVIFEIGSGGFSPFALVWDEKNDHPHWPPVGPGDDDDDEEEPDTPALDRVNHFLYVEGYPEDYRTGEYSDNEDIWPVKPQGNITRAEVATIFYRLLKDEVREEIETDVNSFPDVNKDDWFNITVSSLANMGALSGYEDGTFRPNEPISRAELAAMAVRFYDTFEAEYEEGTFLDVDGDEWYADAIAAAEELGIIGGYPDGTVRPNNNITRAETCAIVNRVLERRPHDEHLGDVEDMRTWPDNQPGAWYYADMQEATNGHYYEWIDIDGSKFEEWTEVDKDYDWTKR